MSERKQLTGPQTVFASTALSVAINTPICLLIGCAPTVQSGVATVNRGLVQIDRAIDRDTRSSIKELDEAIARCKKLELKTPEERAKCLGDSGDPKAIEQMEATRDAYNRIVESLREIEKNK